MPAVTPALQVRTYSSNHLTQPGTYRGWTDVSDGTDARAGGLAAAGGVGPAAPGMNDKLREEAVNPGVSLPSLRRFESVQVVGICA
jgi:hypothetical protein